MKIRGTKWLGLLYKWTDEEDKVVSSYLLAKSLVKMHEEDPEILVFVLQKMLESKAMTFAERLADAMDALADTCVEEATT